RPARSPPAMTAPWPRWRALTPCERGASGVRAPPPMLLPWITQSKPEALDGVDLAVRTGTVHGVLGPNGAGKTTAVRILATLLKADEGSAIVAGYDVAQDPARVREQIGLTGQYASVDELLTGRQNLDLIGALLDLSKKERKARANELLAWFDLSDAA